MINGYSKNKSVQLLVALLIENGIKKVIISPGTTNLEFTAALQYNGGFELFSAIDERSAAYMACGMASISGEVIAITCTEATASRDYFPGITEAYYRKLPILTITGVHKYSYVGNLMPQVIDRSISPKDTFTYKVQLPIIKDQEDYYHTIFEINKALLELKRNGGGPVHIDLPCCDNNYDFSETELPRVKTVKRYYCGDTLPSIRAEKVAIFIGNHKNFDEKTTLLIEKFCGQYNAVVFCDHTSGYYGKYAIHAGVLSFQSCEYDIFKQIDLLIHLGETTGDEPTQKRLIGAQTIWRVCSDGELRNTFGKLDCVFQMDEKTFFSNYDIQVEKVCSYYLTCKMAVDEMKINENILPFSNAYVAAKFTNAIPDGSSVYLGVSNTIRSWTLFSFKNKVKTYSNVGCRGIDGILSSAVGVSLVNSQELTFCVIGDLMFFYDMNAIGNRDITNNLRVIVINNNGGGVFKLDGAPGYRFFGETDTDKYIAAANHFNPCSKSVIKNYVESLGFKYISANTKEELNIVINDFCSKESESPILLEVFTNSEDDRVALRNIRAIKASKLEHLKQKAKGVIGEKGISIARNVFKKL